LCACSFTIEVPKDCTCCHELLLASDFGDEVTIIRFVLDYYETAHYSDFDFLNLDRNYQGMNSPLALAVG